MNKTTILLVAVSKETNRAVAQFGPSWINTFAANGEEAIEKFLQLHQDLVVLGNSLEETEMQKLKKLFLAQHPDLVIVMEKDQSMNANDLLNQIQTKQQQNKPAINFKDDALKDAGLNINIQ